MVFKRLPSFAERSRLNVHLPWRTGAAREHQKQEAGAAYPLDPLPHKLFRGDLLTNP